MDSFSDPESLRDRVGVPFDEETQRLSSEEFESVTEGVDSHAVVGMTNDKGDVLLMNDSSHGWTLLAFPVESGQDWTAIARQEAETLLDASIVLEQLERVRRIDFHHSENNRSTTMYNVVFRASSDDSGVIEGAVERDDDLSLRWFEGVPEEQEGNIVDDIRIFTESEGSG
jgi:hypothetical protein